MLESFVSIVATVDKVLAIQGEDGTIPVEKYRLNIINIGRVLVYLKEYKYNGAKYSANHRALTPGTLISFSYIDLPDVMAGYRTLTYIMCILI